ncbi:MAG: 2-hydroxypenta-2,4-dienoate hydratase [Armatimonadetes bacterium]|nr:2-hydroxypenta-2,4-dienoate hydratase [Armatimonadota bacterium]
MIQDIANRLNAAWERKAAPLSPLSDACPTPDVEVAYRIQCAWTEMRVAAGDRVIGRKIGLTSKAIQQQLGVSEPDYGSLWCSRDVPAPGGRAEVPYDWFLQPRMEGEIAFLLGRALKGPGVTLQEVLAAADAVAPAFEIIDSRIENWRIKIADTIADNASYGGVVIGEWSRAAAAADLRLVGMLMSQNGEVAAEGVGAAALGHPARAVAWLVNKLAAYDVSLAAGEIVISGSLGRAVPAVAGDLFHLEMAGFSPLAVRLA